ncbi:hypothetical protein H4582DRAFT_1208553 [Lactarius indigo]|nr:hypothetical protein H4582DRAFT_1208553 [Lactarius indigo]
MQRVLTLSMSLTEKGDVVYDLLVRPQSPITNHLTVRSDATHALTKPSTILLIHSLELDLHALRLAHPCCIYTALLFTIRTVGLGVGVDIACA